MTEYFYLQLYWELQLVNGGNINILYEMKKANSSDTGYLHPFTTDSSQVCVLQWGILFSCTEAEALFVIIWLLLLLSHKDRETSGEQWAVWDWERSEEAEESSQAVLDQVSIFLFKVKSGWFPHYRNFTWFPIGKTRIYHSQEGNTSYNFCIILLNSKQTNADENTTSLAEVTRPPSCIDMDVCYDYDVDVCLFVWLDWHQRVCTAYCPLPGMPKASRSKVRPGAVSPRQMSSSWWTWSMTLWATCFIQKCFRSIIVRKNDSRRTVSL